MEPLSAALLVLLGTALAIVGAMLVDHGPALPGASRSPELFGLACLNFLNTTYGPSTRPKTPTSSGSKRMSNHADFRPRSACGRSCR